MSAGSGPTVEERFWSKVDKTDDCWIWTAVQSTTGYGMFWFEGKTHFAHRVSYELLVGPIPEGLVTDHLCRTPLCVNPAHLEMVTQRENTLRGNSPAASHAQKTHCPKGHEYTPENTYVNERQRWCLTCRRERNRARAVRERKAREAARGSV